MVSDYQLRRAGLARGNFQVLSGWDVSPRLLNFPSTSYHYGQSGEMWPYVSTIVVHFWRPNQKQLKDEVRRIRDQSFCYGTRRRPLRYNELVFCL